MKLLERDHLLTQMTELLAKAKGGQGVCVFIGGEAGVGKTSLVRWFDGSSMADRQASPHCGASAMHCKRRTHWLRCMT